MPQVGQDLPSGKIVSWLKKVGDPVKKGDLVATVESEKATFEVEAEKSGVLLKVLYEEGAEVEVLKPIALVRENGETIDPSVKPPPASSAPLEAVSLGRLEARQRATTQPARPERIPVSPAARRLALEKGIDLKTIRGTGPGGRITSADIEAGITGTTVPAPATEALKPSHETGGDSAEAKAADSTVPFSRMRQQIADRLTQSKQTIPHFHLSVDVDMTPAVAWRTRYNQADGSQITFTDLIIKASAIALVRFPRMNAQVAKDHLVLKRSINIGVAVSVEDGLRVPVIPHADRLNLKDIARISKENAEQARKGKLSSFQEGTFTISSLGMHGIRNFLPIINPPQCAILAVGSIAKRVVAVGDSIRIRDIMTLTLAADHRAVDGVIAAKFLNEIKLVLEQIEQPCGSGAECSKRPVTP